MSFGEPLVTIVIPAYNAGQDIRDTLQSVQSQRLRDFEAIVVDDGSQDKTCAIVQSFADRDPRFRLVRQHNSGVGAARNAAIRLARGRFIAPLDADDQWAPDKLVRQVEVLENSDAKSALVYCWSRRVDDQGRTIAFSHPYAVEGRTHRAMILRNFLGNASVPLFRKSVIDRVGFYLTRNEQGGAQGCEDWDLNLRIAEQYDVRVVPDYLVRYRQRLASMSFDAVPMLRSYQLLLRRARQRNPQLSPAIFRWSAGHFYFWLASKSYHSGRYAGFFRAVVPALLADPVLLFSPKLYRMLAGSVVHPVTRSHFRQAAPGRNSASSLPPGASPLTLHARGFFDRLQLNRWTTACN